MLADMATEIEAARLLTWKACWLIDQGMDSTMASSMCKIFATEMAERVCSGAIQILGWARIYPQMAIREVFKGCKSPPDI